MSQGFDTNEHLTMSLPSDSPSRPFGDFFEELVTKPIKIDDEVNKIDLEIESCEKKIESKESTSNSDSLFPYSSKDEFETVFNNKWKNLVQNDYRQSPINIFISMPKEVEIVNSRSCIDGMLLKFVYY